MVSKGNTAGDSEKGSWNLPKYSTLERKNRLNILFGGQLWKFKIRNDDYCIYSKHYRRNYTYDLCYF